MLCCCLDGKGSIGAQGGYDYVGARHGPADDLSASSLTLNLTRLPQSLDGLYQGMMIF
jgi:hypothetical protein